MKRGGRQGADGDAHRGDQRGSRGWNKGSRLQQLEQKPEAKVVGAPEGADAEDVAMEDVSGDGGDGVEGGRGAPKCSRCTKKGHLAAKCVTELYCVICNTRDDHVNHRCPLLKMPRPVAYAVGYAVHGLGFFHIPHPPLSRTKKEAKSVLIRVTGGSLARSKCWHSYRDYLEGKESGRCWSLVMKLLWQSFQPRLSSSVLWLLEGLM